MTGEELYRKLNKLSKWRMLFAGWQLGTRLDDDPEGQAVKDHREVTIVLRAEVTALTGLLLRKGICSEDELRREIAQEAEFLDQQYEERFPGFETSEAGLIVAD